MRQFNDAFEGVRSVNDIKKAKLEKHLSRQEITVNIGDLKRKFSVSTDILTIVIMYLEYLLKNSHFNRIIIFL